MIGDGEYTYKGRKVTVSTGNIGPHTFLQAVAMSLVLTPFAAALHQDWSLGSLAWYAVCLMCAPFIVDAFKTVHTYH